MGRSMTLAGLFYSRHPRPIRRFGPRIGSHSPRRPKLLLEALEPRVLLSADPQLVPLDVLEPSVVLDMPLDAPLTVEAADTDPDDQISEAMPMGTAETRTGLEVDSPTDVDMFSVTVAAGQTVGIDIDDPAGSSLNSWIRVFDAYGAELAFNNDGRGPGEGFSGESYLEYRFALAGTYYLGVSGAFNSGYDPVTGTGDATGSAGPYTLVLTGGDPDDTLSEAVAIGTAETRTGLEVDSPTDVDMFSVTVAAGQTVGIDIDEPAGGSLNSWIRLFDAYGAELASNNDGRGPGEGFSGESYLEYRFVLAGTYYLGVSGAFNSAYDPVTGTADIPGSTGSYTLILSAAAGPPAPGPSTDGDPDDQVNEAIPIDTTETRTGSIDSPTGVDMFSFTVVAGQTVGF